MKTVVAMSLEDVFEQHDHKENQAWKAEKKAFQEQVKSLIEQLARARKPRIRLEPTLRERASESDTWVRVIVPDTHGQAINKEAFSLMLADMRALYPLEIILIGDHLNCGGFLAQHHTMGYVAETAYTFEDDVQATNNMLDQLYMTCPQARIEYLEGNHERRIEKWCVTQSLGKKQDSAYLLSLFSPEKVLSLEKRGIPYYRTMEYYDGLRIPGTIKRGHCHFTHGTKHGKNSAKDMLRMFAANVVYGHVHKHLEHSDKTVVNGDAKAWACGYLGDKQPCWKHSDITDWVHGYAVQWCHKDGNFLHANVPIIEGKSILEPVLHWSGKL